MNETRREAQKDDDKEEVEREERAYQSKDGEERKKQTLFRLIISIVLVCYLTLIICWTQEPKVDFLIHNIRCISIIIILFHHFFHSFYLSDVSTSVVLISKCLIFPFNQSEFNTQKSSDKSTI